jgi:hypothetical protein
MRKVGWGMGDGCSPLVPVCALRNCGRNRVLSDLNPHFSSCSPFWWDEGLCMACLMAYLLQYSLLFCLLLSGSPFASGLNVILTGWHQLWKCKAHCLKCGTCSSPLGLLPPVPMPCFPLWVVSGRSHSEGFLCVALVWFLSLSWEKPVLGLCWVPGVTRWYSSWGVVADQRG